jgi:hypothetical protein
MNHGQALDSQIVERYLLGELPAAEAEDFECHYFECQECALAVESGRMFIENAREIFKDNKSVSARNAPPMRNPRRRIAVAYGNVFGELWGRPFVVAPWAAAVLLGAVAIYQAAILIPGARRSVEVAQALPSFQLSGATRGEGGRISVPAGTPFISLMADLPPGEKYSQYLCILTSGGRTVFRVAALPPAEGLPVTILAPVKDLKPGQFELSIYGSAPDGRQGDKLSSNSFDFKFD